jgi:outer membrane protein assembly factor BamB
MVLLDEAVTTDAAQVVDLDVMKPVLPSTLAGRSGRADSTTQTATYALPILRQGRLSVDGGQIAAGARELFVGVERASGSLVWAHLLREAPLAVTPIHGGFVACDSGGGLSWVDHRGRRADEVVFEARLMACVMQQGRSRQPVLSPSPPLEDQVASALSVSGQRPTELDQWLLNRFGQLEPPSVTRVLIGLAQDSRLSPVLTRAADEVLARRDNGVEHMLRALKRHYDFLSGVLQPPPVGALADALGRLGVERAAPLLAEHLNDPANSPNAVRRAARALEKLATADQRDELRTFFSLYRATADDPELVAAVVSVARALLRVGGAEAKRLVASAATDSLTQPAVQRGLRTLAERAPPP